MASQPPFTEALVSEALQWGQLLRDDWAQEFPVENVAPAQIMEDLRSFIEDDEHRRIRIRRVMRLLRRKNPRAYDVLYRTMILGLSLDEMTAWLNERAARNDIDQTYRAKDTLALFIAGVSFCRSHWGASSS